MQIGVKLDQAIYSDVKRAAQEAERIGFDSIWLSERVATPLDKPHPFEPMIDPWVGLAFIAGVTERVMLGTSVSQIALRPPLLIARELATIDRLSGGRLIVGAGAGWVEEEFTSTGVPFDTRGGRLNEVIRVLRHLWNTPGQPWQGKFFQIPAVGLVKPATRGGPPLYVGASGPAGIRRAARYGDGFIASPLPIETLIRLKGRLAELRKEFGRAGSFPFVAQASPPGSVEDAKLMARDYSAAGIDSLILTYKGNVPDAFLAEREVASCLIESAHERYSQSGL